MKQCTLQKRHALAEARVIEKLRNHPEGVGALSTDEVGVMMFSPIERSRLRALEVAGRIRFHAGKWFL